MLTHGNFTTTVTPLLKQSIKILLLPFWLGLWCFALGLLCWYLLRGWPGDRLYPVRLLNYFTPWLLFGLLPGLTAAVLARRYSLATALALPAVLISLTYAPLFLPRAPIALAADTPLKVMSYNIWGRNQKLDEAMAIIQQEQPDILLLQEAYWPTGASLSIALANLYPDTKIYTAYEPDMGQLIISRYPLTPVETSFQKGRAQKVWANTPKGPIAVWNVHPFQPSLWRKQYRQFESLANDIACTKTPLIVGGDFNTTEQAQNYRLINQHLSNAHWEAGWGFGFSFPAHNPTYKQIPIITPMVRIDHIFYSNHFFARSAQTLATSGGSDHLPITAELSLIE
jgi:vancomycin resistance protein VanJ